MNAKKALFGGALMAAGMTAQAQAQNLIYLDSGVGGAYPSFAVSFAYGAAAPDTAYAPAALNTTSSAYNPLTGTTTMTTSQSAGGFGSTAAWAGDGLNGYGYGYTQIQQFFMVDAAAQLLIEWDYTGTDGYAAALVLETAGGGTTIFSNTGQLGDPFSGSALVNVDPGVEYAFLGGFTDPGSGFGPFIFSSTDTQFINVSIVPTPGVAGLFGMAGLAATRRRR